MTIERVLSVVPVSDVTVADDWYGRLFDRAPTNRPMDTMTEWKVTESGWVQVFLDPERAGTGLLNFSVDDLEHHRAGLIERGFTPGPIEEADKGVQLSSVSDPDGNSITFIGNFREVY